MIIFEITGREDSPAYRDLEVSNGERQFDFLRSTVAASLALKRPFISQHLLKALNFHAIACLHTSAGEFRPCEVTVGAYRPPSPHRVQAQMDDFINQVNRAWETADPVFLACYVLWRLNYIHPFINGNGRTARAACLFVLCVKAGGWLSGEPILPDLLKRERANYVAALQVADRTFEATGDADLRLLHGLVASLLYEQLNGVRDEPQVDEPAAAAPVVENNIDPEEIRPRREPDDNDAAVQE
ncbi:Fic family protein [Aestuariivirga sp.]|uniref:Fic family protein n=1 Tax=Aestuariivirga sp. TaxID=2650926 RepID=UPI0039E46BF6